MKTVFHALLILSLSLLLPDMAAAQSETYFAGVVQHEATNIPPVQLVARLDLPLAPGGINDFSGIATRDGVTLTLLSDHGFLLTARLQRGYGQQITGIQYLHQVPLMDAQGIALHGARHDSEGLAIGPDGRIYVSFEQHNRVTTFARPGAPEQSLGEHFDFERMRAGRGMEALALAADGSLYAIPERPARATYGFPSYRLRNGEWEGSFRLPQDGTFLPVGADFGPDGLLYVLERDEGAQGLRSQVRRFAVRGRAISEPLVVMRSAYGQFPNLEGLSVFRDWSGRIRLLMVSDDDLALGPRSEIIDLVLNR